jgi:hypothetical protein
LLDSSNNKVTLLVGQAPIVTKTGDPSFVTTTPLAEYPVFISGLPTPTVSAYLFTTDPSVPGRILLPLPPGITVIPGVNPLVDGTVKFHFLGAQSTPGTYPVMLQVGNGAGTAVADFLITVTGPDVNHPITFLDPPPQGFERQAHWIAGKPVNEKWRVDASGLVTFYILGAFPPGLTFQDNGDNTFMIGGTPTSAVPAASVGFGANENLLQACYGQIHCSQVRVNFDIVAPPPATLAGPTFLKFPSNLTTTYTLTTSGGAITPVTIDTPCGVSPWATLTDNHDGTATLTGTPPAGNSDAYAFRVRVTTAGLPPPADADGTACHPLNFTIKADNTPLITSPSTATFKVGQGDRFYFTSNVPDADFTLQSSLPAGLRFSTFHNGTADIVGTPQAGTGGDYSIFYYSADSLNGNILRRTLLLRVQEAPSLTLPPTVYFMVGVPNKFVVTPKGFPKYGEMQVSLQNPLPSGVSYNDVTNINPLPGSGTLHGTPAAGTEGNDYPLTFTATNSQGADTKNTTLHILRRVTSIATG